MGGSKEKKSKINKRGRIVYLALKRKRHLKKCHFHVIFKVSIQWL